MPIELNGSIEMQSSIQTGNYVELPFPYLRLNWHNGGDRAGKDTGHPSWFGGFQRGKEDVDADLTGMNMDALPAYFVGPDKWLNQDEKEYDAYGSRFIYAAPILAKDDWYDEQGDHGMKRVHRLDYLVYLASTKDKLLIPWGPAVISRTGYAASFILDAFKGWQKDTADIRRQFAPKVPPEFFYHCVGTFGNERHTKAAGQRQVAVCEFNKPSAWNEDLLERFFVGGDIAELMATLQKAAQEWYDDKRGTKQEARGKKQNVEYDNVPVDNSEGPEPFPF